MIASLREAGLICLSQKLKVTMIYRLSQIINLISCIINIILSNHRITCSSQHIYQSTPCCCTTAMTYMERSSRICTHILNLNRSHILFWQLTKAIQILINCHQGIINHIGLKEEINKARTSNLYPVKPVTRNAAGNFLSNLPRCHVKSTCRLHCHIGSKVTKLLFGRNLQHNIRQLSLWQGTSFNS